jgi:hypothetical protein
MITAKPHEDYAMLVKQYNAIKSLFNNQCLTVKTLREKDYSCSIEQLRALSSRLDSEMDMNAQLTEELAKYEY